ncbi:MAG: PhzF family phenazine biosynthesis protein [Myxococcales bacterium]|nr:PhzF family phenazine biosynthesis protein [Myxococcales bacterium]USN50451.1 MAG: PhzF family phenazine biosynthesis protein [Myxococcales bacterium]
MSIIVFQVDSFSSVPFKGNPAGVCVLNEPANEKWMQDIAMEMNLSETAFLWPQGNKYGLRWFTPSVEVNLCGHATLAAAHILWEQKYLSENETAKFITKSGLLSASKRGEKIYLDFPSQPPTQCLPPLLLTEAFDEKIVFCGNNHQNDFLLEFESEALVRNFKPKFDVLKKLAIRGLIVTAQSFNKDYDFVSRFFACGVGVDEDPVTGSTHCALAPYWSKKLASNNLVAFQASKRGGVVGCELKGDRVILSGAALTIFRIEMLS